MGVTIPCGRSWWKPGDIAGHCVAGHLCPNCTALRGLMAACEQNKTDLEALNREVVISVRTVFRYTEPMIDRLRAALAAARPAGGECGEE